MRTLLLKGQSNELLYTVRAAGLDPSDFDWEVQTYSYKTVPRQISICTHRPTGYSFSFWYNDEATSFLGEWGIEYSPGRELLRPTATSVGWYGLRSNFEEWLKSIKREIETPDLWAMLAKESQLVEAAVSTSTDNTPFTPDEQKYIAEQLREIKAFLEATADLSEEQQEFVERRLSYLEESARRSLRIDWINQLIAVLFSIIVSAAFAPGRARELFQFAGNAFRQLIDQFPALP